MKVFLWFPGFLSMMFTWWFTGFQPAGLSILIYVVFLYISKKAGAKQDVGDVRFRCMHVPYCYFAIVSNRLIPSPMIFVHTGVHRHILTWSNVTIISPLKIYVIKNTASAEIIKDVTSIITKKKHEWGSLEFAILACLTSVWSVLSCHKSECRSTSFRETLDG